MPFIKHSINGQMAGVIELRNQVSIGRSSSNEIVVEDPTVSLVHAKVYEENGDWYVADCESTNGIRLGKQAVTVSPLCDGDVISIGTQEFEFSVALPASLDKTLKIKKSWIPGVYYTE